MIREYCEVCTRKVTGRPSRTCANQDVVRCQYTSENVWKPHNLIALLNILVAFHSIYERLCIVIDAFAAGIVLYRSSVAIFRPGISKTTSTAFHGIRRASFRQLDVRHDVCIVIVRVQHGRGHYAHCFVEDLNRMRTL
jgi:hypothetical protein